MEIGEVIALNLKRLREERNLSMGQLADLAGVSKVILSQIEKGTSNPTINTILKISGALNLPYTSLLEEPEARVVHVEKSKVAEFVDGQYHRFNYFLKNRDRDFDMYQIELDPGCVRPFEGHESAGSEYLMVLSGSMELTVGNKDYVLKADDALFFDASIPHECRNKGNKKVKAVMMVCY